MTVQLKMRKQKKKTKIAIKPDVHDVPEKLCHETEVQKSDAMEPKQTESEPEAQKSDVCNEINKSDAVEPKQTESEMEPKQNESKTEAQKSDICKEINKSGAVEQPKKLCETDEKSGVMEPRETESETEAQKSDVCNEVREHLTEPKQIETETGPNESENESIGSKKNDVCKGDGLYTADESEEYEDNDTNQTEVSYVQTEDSE